MMEWLQTSWLIERGEERLGTLGMQRETMMGSVVTYCCLSRTQMIGENDWRQQQLRLQVRVAVQLYFENRCYLLARRLLQEQEKATTRVKEEGQPESETLGLLLKDEVEGGHMGALKNGRC